MRGGETREESCDLRDGQALNGERVVTVALVFEARGDDEAQAGGVDGGDERREGRQPQRIVVIRRDNFHCADRRSGETGGEVLTPVGERGVEHGNR